MNYTRFRNETPNAKVSLSPNWALGNGSPDTLSFLGAGIAGAGGEAVCLYRSAPLGLHQSAEIKFAFSGDGAAGVALRYTDIANFVMARVHHVSTPATEIIERVGGVDTVLATLPVAPDYGSLRLEIVGKRARLYVEFYGPVQERAPDIAVNLSGSYAAGGGWGVYMNGAGGCIQSWAARDLPSAVLAPPALSVADASGLALTPISIAIAGNTQPQLELEIVPADEDDFPEAYRDISAGSITNRTALVRPGYRYKVRARGVGQAGPAPWSDYQTITAPGAKSAPPSITLPADAFPNLVPDYTLEQTQSTEITATVANTGHERTSTSWARPRNQFKLSFSLLSDAQAQTLIDFFERMQGQNKPFQWTHPTTGEVFAVRFATDDYLCESTDQGDESAWWKISFDLIEVVVGVTTVLNLSLSADPSLFPEAGGTATTSYQPGQIDGDVGNLITAPAQVVVWPDRIGGADLVLWLSADGIDNTADNTPVALWPDRSGYGNDASTTAAPTYHTSIVNGQPVLRFGGAQWMRVSSLVLNRPFTAYIVHVKGSGRALSTYTGSPDWSLGNTGTNYGHWVGAWCGGSTVAPTPSPAIHEGIDDVSSSAYYLNGNLVGTSTATTAPAAGTLCVGGCVASNLLFSGDILEVIVYRRVLNATERGGILNYLKAKYAIS